MFGLTRRNQDMTTFNPWHDMEEFEKTFFSNPFGSLWGAQALNQFRTDVTDEGDHYLLETDLLKTGKIGLQQDRKSVV